jgi:hypothetical protein
MKPPEEEGDAGGDREDHREVAQDEVKVYQRFLRSAVAGRGRFSSLPAPPADRKFPFRPAIFL